MNDLFGFITKVIDFLRSILVNGEPRR